MWETSLQFLRAGLQTSIQDTGRTGMQSYGLPKGGAIDTHSMIIANRLVGNDHSTPTLEIALVGPKIKVTGDAYIAVTGAEIDLSINNSKAEMYETIHVASGSVIDLGTIKNGARSYLAINGKWQIDKWLDSCSPLPISNIKSLQSNQMTNNRILIINTQKLISKKKCPTQLRTKFHTQNKLRVLRGPEYSLMSSDNQKFFEETEFTIHKNSNRMAVSLEESIPNYENQKELISSANLVGTIQLTKQGQPLILMNDAGTTGGYPRIANVITADLPKVAQLRASQKVIFEFVSLDYAIKELEKEKEILLSLK